MFLDILFILSSLLAIGCAFLVVTTKNLMHACIFLLGSLFGVAGLYASLGADFLAATQLVVYAGGVVILMLFAIMLTGGGDNLMNKFGIEKVPAMGGIKNYIIAALSCVVLASVVLKIISGVVRSGMAGELPEFTATVHKIGTLLATDHILSFEISSILLLGALIGAAVISRPRVR